MLTESDAGRRFALGLTSLPQQRCKRAKYDPNHLAMDMQRLAVDNQAQTPQPQGGPQNLSQQTSVWGVRTPATDDAGESDHVDFATQGLAQGLKQLQCHDRKPPAEPPAEPEPTTTDTWGVPPTETPAAEPTNMCSDEFDEELSYLASQVQLSGSASSPAQAMPYIF